MPKYIYQFLLIILMSNNSHYIKRFKGSSPEHNMQNNTKMENNDDNLYHKHHKHNKHADIKQEKHNVLLYTITNQRYVITIEAIWKISHTFGNVLRIIMVRKRVTKVLVEFDDNETAAAAMKGLHNQDIYSGCCTLDVKYASTDTLHVRKNDSNTWDFTVQPQLTSEATKQPLITSGVSPMGSGRFGDTYSQQAYGSQMVSPNYGVTAQVYDGGQGARTVVAIMYGLTEKVNCTHIFNLLCLYGNVMKVKFMKSKPDTAMIEFSSADGVSKATRLTGYELFGTKLTLKPSHKSHFVGQPKGDPYELADGSPSFEDFSQSKFNRFINAEKAARNRVQDPRATVHFFNAPPDVTEEKIKEALNDDSESFDIQQLVMFPKKDSAKSSAGLVELADTSQAMNCLAMFNHVSMDSAESAYPYNVKFCFATQDLK